MKMRGAVAVALFAIPVVAVAPAQAVSTRAEYIAQVDPICQSFEPRATKANKVFNKNFTEWERRATKGTLKGWVRQTERTARSMRRFTQIHAGLTDQIAAVPPPAEDGATVGTWLQYRNKAEVSGYSAAMALFAFKIKRFYRQFDHAVEADTAGARAISGFGFQVCGVSV